MILNTFIIVVVLAGFNPITGGQDAMVFPKPEFNTVEECTEFAVANRNPLFYRTWEYYGVRPVQQVYCAPSEEALKLIEPRDLGDGIIEQDLPPLNFGGLNT